MRSTDDYLALVPPEHAGKPKFMATVAFSVQPLADIQAFFAGLPLAFDIDEAIGVQLDAVGVRVGISRDVTIPLPSPWFSLDDPIRGLDRAPLKGPFDTGTYISMLDDDTYRRLLYGKRTANSGDGSAVSAAAVLNAYVDNPATLIFVYDATAVPTALFFSLDDPARGLDGPAVLFSEGTSISPLSSADMIYVIGIAGQLPDLVDTEIIGQQLLPLIPIGVRADIEFTSVDGAPIFGLDVENQYISGPDVGALGVSADFIASLPY